MTTVLLWLLLSIGDNGGTSSQKTTNVVEKFATVQECERVRAAITEGMFRPPRMRCIQATVVRP